MPTLQQRQAWVAEVMLSETCDQPYALEHVVPLYSLAKERAYPARPLASMNI